jgi:hypothetical protein
VKDMDKMALIGPAYHEYKSELLELIRRKGKVWSSWTYYHPEHKERIFRGQLNRDEYFYIYVHVTKNPSPARRREGATVGSGLVEYRLRVIEMDYEHRKRGSPDLNLTIDKEKMEKSCGWYLVNKIDPINSRHWQSFIDYQTRTNLAPFWMKRPNVRWGYIVDSYPD